MDELDNGRPSVDGDQIVRWMTAAGRRIGLGDWRPQKSGEHGRFTVAESSWM
ncbi:MAG: hypothetical protein OXK21_06395 [Chloroflexota bacterium]|nr:hypothetical protein [Chloroflexota bacterium]